MDPRPVPSTHQDNWTDAAPASVKKEEHATMNLKNSFTGSHAIHDQVSMHLLIFFQALASLLLQHLDCRVEHLQPVRGEGHGILDILGFCCFEATWWGATNCTSRHVVQLLACRGGAVDEMVGREGDAEPGDFSGCSPPSAHNSAPF